MNTKPKILIVDDKPENLKALRKVLKDLDIELVEATSGNDALKAVLRHDFTLALLDIQMPEMDGYELAGILREEEKTAHLPFIFISAVYTDNLNVFKGYEKGAFSFITKPFQPEILINKVKFFIDKHQQEIALFELNEELERKVKQIADYKYALDESSIVAITDQKGIIKEVNNNFCTFSKYSREELIGQDHRIINSDYHSKEFFHDLWKTIASGKIWRGEVKNKAKDGSIFWLDTTIVPFLDEGGKPYQYIAIRSDITERKKADQQCLRIAEELNKAQEIANSGSFESNFITEIDTWSENFYKIFEFNKEEVTPSFETFLSRIHPDDKHIAEEALATIEMERKIVEMDVRAIMPKGSVKWVSSHMLPIFDGDKIIGLKGVMLDITERKNTEEKFFIVSRRLSLAVRAGRIGIWEFDIINNKLVWDDGMFRLYGITEQTFSGVYEVWINGLHPEDIERCKDEVRAAIAGEKEFNTEFRIIWSDSSVHYIRGIADVQRDDGGNAVRLIGTNWDITESKKNEEYLKKSVREIADYKFALDASAIVALTDTKGFIKDVNDNFCKITKYSKDELIGQDHRIINSGYHPKEFIRNLWETITNGKVWRGEIKNKAKDGTFYWVDTTIVPFLNQQGKPVQYLALRIDITERKKAEEDLLKVNAELESFSYSVSHDLRAPLRAIIGFTSILEEEYSSKLDDEAKRITNIIKTNTAKMGSLIDDLLAFSRLGRQLVVKTGIRIDVMLKEVIEEQNRLNKDHSVEWLVHPLPDINGDINLMRQVWINLISNAVKYSDKKEQPCIEIGSFTQDGLTVFFVKDNGVGFDEQYSDKLFKVFQRLHSAEEFEGTGVGLAIVEKIISKHGGKVWAEGEVDKGACFYFSIPIE